MNHKELEVWKNSRVLVREIYSATSWFPSSELFGLTSQIRRSVISIPANLSEGAGRKSTKEFVHFAWIAYGSLSELETLLILATDLGYITTEQSDLLLQLIKRITIQLKNLIRSLTDKINNQTTNR